MFIEIYLFKSDEEQENILNNELLNNELRYFYLQKRIITSHNNPFLQSQKFSHDKLK